MRTRLLLLISTLVIVVPARGQYVDDASWEDATVLPRGKMRLGLDIFRQFWTQRFTTSGDRERWSLDFEPSPFGPAAVPTLAPIQDSLRALTGITDYELTLGGAQLETNVDLRGSPLRLELGLTDRLMIGVSAPFVRSATQARLSLDSTTANVGWNPLAGPATDPAVALTTYNTFFDQLDTAIGSLTSGIAGGQFGCPTNCATAQDLLTRATSFRDALFTVLFGGGSTNASAVFPLMDSAAGTALSQLVSGLQTDFSALNITGFAQGLLFPAGALIPGDFQDIVSAAEFGIQGDPLVDVSRWKLGDVALSAKVLLVNGANYRAAVTGVVRLPTGTLDDPNNFLDFPSGDKQLDIEARLHQDFRLFDDLTIATMARYVYQRPSTLTRRVTPHTTPLALLTTSASVERDLGDIFQASIRPTITLTPQVSVSLYGMYHRKTSDKFTLSTSGPGGLDASVLELDTEEQAWRVGGGVRYFASDRFETGLQHVATFRGSGGLTPVRSHTTVIVRLYFGLWSGRQPAQAD